LLGKLIYELLEMDFNQILKSKFHYNIISKYLKGKLTKLLAILPFTDWPFRFILFYPSKFEEEDEGRRKKKKEEEEEKEEERKRKKKKEKRRMKKKKKKERKIKKEVV